MNKRSHNPNLPKKHRSYTTEEVAILFDIHKNTVRAWIKDGLPVINDKRPFLILGNALAEYLRSKRTRNKQTCKNGEMYCFKCRVPREPVDGLIEMQPVNEKTVNRKGICPICGTIMNRRISIAKLNQSRESEKTETLVQEHIVDTCLPSLNRYFKEDVERC